MEAGELATASFGDVMLQVRAARARRGACRQLHALRLVHGAPTGLPQRPGTPGCPWSRSPVHEASHGVSPSRIRPAPPRLAAPVQAIGGVYKAQAEIFLGGVLDGSLAALK